MSVLIFVSTSYPFILADIPLFDDLDSFFLSGPEKHDLEEKEGEMPYPIKRMKHEVEKGSPSSMANPRLFKTLAGPQHVIGCNRPYETDTIPVALLHPVFGIFKDRCKEPPSELALSLLNAINPVACEWQDFEIQRRSVVREMFQRYLGLNFLEQKIPGTEYATDGNLSAIVMPTAIRECKNEHGEPLNQAILYYANFLKYAFVAHQYHNVDSRFPCILLIDMGSSLEFHGAVWDGSRVRIEPLTRSFNFTTHWLGEDRETIASGFDALVLAIQHLEVHYKKVATEAKVGPTKSFDKHHQKACGFPFMTSYTVDGQEQTFTYNQRLIESKLVFLATMNQPEPIKCVVKFARRYSEVSHRLLASHDSAPALTQCIRLSTEWVAIVMAWTNYEVLDDLNLTKEEQKKVLEKVKEIVQILHNEGLVHGDIRTTNILVDCTSEEVKIHFLDFDWAGRIGEVKYPIGINRETVRRPEGAEGGKLITVQHDHEMVSYLFA